LGKPYRVKGLAMNDQTDFQEWIATELEREYSLEMTRAMLRSDAVATDRDVTEFATILGIGRRYPVTRRWPHRWTCSRGVWAGALW
jgi:hypothetical protein